MAPVFKKKGPIEICDNSRGILLEDHSGKALKGIIKSCIDPAYESHMPQSQFGAVRGRGTDMASHIVRSAIDAAKLLHLSLFVLFVDLVKAFDKIIRQLVYGWGPVRPPDAVAQLLQARRI